MSKQDKRFWCYDKAFNNINYDKQLTIYKFLLMKLDFWVTLSSYIKRGKDYSTMNLPVCILSSTL